MIRQQFPNSLYVWKFEYVVCLLILFWMSGCKENLTQTAPANASSRANPVTGGAEMQSAQQKNQPTIQNMASGSAVQIIAPSSKPDSQKITVLQSETIGKISAPANASSIGNSNQKIPDEDLEKKYELAYSQFHAGNYTKAIFTANKVLEKDATHYKSRNIKGIALCFSDNFTEGMKCIDTALSIAPDYWYARFNKALAYSYKKNFESALKWYDQSLSVHNYSWSHYGKAAIYGQLGDVENTVKNLKIAIEMDKDCKETAKHEKDFDRVRNAKSFQALVY